MNGSRSHGLDGLRGFAALAVVVYHSILGLDSSQITRILRPDFSRIEGGYNLATKFFLLLFNGETAVVMFFTLSGLVLFRSLERQGGESWRAGLAFLARRFFRIYPTFLVCLMTCVVVFGLAGIPLASEDILGNLVLWRSSVHGASWTLQVELLAAPYVLASYVCYRRYGFAGLVAVLAVAMTILAIIATKDRFYSMKGYLPCFFVGILVALPVGKAVAARLPQWAWAPLLVASLSARHVIPVGGLAQVVEYLATGLLVSQLYYHRAGRLQAAMEAPTAQFLGRISYSLYLFNVVIMEVAQAILRDHMGAAQRPLEYGLASSLFIVAVSIPLAALGEKFIERPTDAWGHGVAKAILNFGGSASPKVVAVVLAPLPEK